MREGYFGIRVSSKVQFLCQFLIERHLFPECIHANPSSLEGASLLAVELRPEIEGICQDLQVVKRGSDSEKRRRTPIFLAATAVGCIVHYKNGQLQRSIILLTLSSTRI